MWTNHYLCPCGTRWQDDWSCTCNDRCPACNKEIEPYISDDGSVSPGKIIAVYAETLARMGLIECIECEVSKVAPEVQKQEAGPTCQECSAKHIH